MITFLVGDQTVLVLLGIFVLKENLLPLFAPDDYMIECSLILNPRFPGHPKLTTISRGGVNIKTLKSDLHRYTHSK